MCDTSGNCSRTVDPVNYTPEDKTAPVFLRTDPMPLSICANDLEGGLGKIEGITGLGIVRGEDYDDNDNCNPITVQYRIRNLTHPLKSVGWTAGDDPSGETFWQGVSEVDFRLEDTSGNATHEDGAVMWRITILDMPAPGTIGGN